MADLFKLNNSAVFQMEKETYDEAITTLTRALKRVKMVISGDAMLAETPDEEDNTTVDERPSNTSTLDFDFLSYSGKPSFLPTRVGTIFQDAIYVANPFPQPLLQTYEQLSYVVLYNLALAHHLRAMEEDCKRLRNARLQQALCLYEHAHQILLNQEIEVSALHNMAIASNLGHIHRFLGDESRAQLCFQHLLSTLLYIVDCGAGDKLKSLDGFFCNVMPLIVGMASSAPAA
jgi:hypothetical protein